MRLDYREAINFLCEYVLEKKYSLKFALEAKPNEPRADMYNPTTGHMLAFIGTLDHSEMVGVNPEVAHEHMSGINFMHGVAQAWEAGKLFHIDLNDQYPGRYDQDLRFGFARSQGGFLPSEVSRRCGILRIASLRCSCLSHRGLRRCKGFRPWMHAHLPRSKRKGYAI